jgi:nucleoside-diphosphate-sugar epimerase
MPPSVLVTGATGFIGSHLVEALAAKNWRVTCLVRPKSRTHRLQKLPIALISGSWNDTSILDKAVRGQDYVFHLAGRIRSAPKVVYKQANSLFTKNLIRACLKTNPNIERFIYVSSISAAGPSPPGIFSDESQIPSPTSEYGRTKLQGEIAVQDARDQLPSTIIRPPAVYGPRQQETEMLISIISKRIVPILKDETKITSLIYIDDLIHGILQAALSSQASGQVYYLCNKQGYSWRNLILMLKKHVLGESLFLPIPEELISFLAWFTDILKSFGYIRIYFGRRIWKAMVQTPWLFSPEKAEKDFGFKPQYSLQKGIEKTVNYYKSLP